MNTGLEEAFDVTQDAFVADTVGHKGHQLVLVHVVEEATYVGFDEMMGQAAFDSLAWRSQCIMTASSWPKSVRVVYEVLLIDRLQDFNEARLDEFVFQCRYPQGLYLGAARFGDVNPYHRLRDVRHPVESVD